MVDIKSATVLRTATIKIRIIFVNFVHSFCKPGKPIIIKLQIPEKLFVYFGMMMINVNLQLLKSE